MNNFILLWQKQWLVLVSAALLSQWDEHKEEVVGHQKRLVNGPFKISDTIYCNVNDKTGNYWIFRLIYNNIVKMVLNIHTSTSSDANVLRSKRNPRINEFKRKHVCLIWGDQHGNNWTFLIYII